MASETHKTEQKGLTAECKTARTHGKTLGRAAKNLIALGITIIFTVCVLNNINVETIKSTFSGFDPKSLYTLLTLFVSVMMLRTLRWRLFLPQNRCKIMPMFGIYMLSSLLNIFLPARAGDIFRGCYFGQKYEISKSEALGTVAAERIADGLTVVLILACAVVFWQKTAFTVNLVTTAAILFVSSFLTMFYLCKYDKIGVFCGKIRSCGERIGHAGIKNVLIKATDFAEPVLNSFTAGFKAFCNFKTLAGITALSLVAWGGDCVFSYILVKSFGIAVPFSVSFFIVTFIALSTIIPSSSIYIGLYQYAFILALAIFDIDKSSALTVAVAQQAIMLGTFAIVSVLYLFADGNAVKELKKEGEKKCLTPRNH
ncbi:MAG: lysylphosphatidylglycerol synthase transmembrane domain-containing protein [Candidatus Gastranaerophilaceae bacterium]